MVIYSCFSIAILYVKYLWSSDLYSIDCHLLIFYGALNGGDYFMAKPDWGELQQRFLSDHAKSGISPKDWC